MPEDRAARRAAIRAAIEADPAQTNTAIAKRFRASRDLVIEVRRQQAGALVMGRYESTCRTIAECAAVDEVKDIRDKARALEVYTQQAKNREAEEQAREVRLRAERRGGEIMLTQIVREAQPMADSRVVAKMFSKEHKHVMRDIRDLIELGPEQRSKFELTFDAVPEPKGGARRGPYYVMNEEGFMRLVMPFTGAAAYAVRKAFYSGLSGNARDARRAARGVRRMHARLGTAGARIEAARHGWCARSQYPQA
ncbi:Rha family transcriptional regulator [Paraburkholderia tuberum]|uniref:Rha family transcriptional regulator n=1 Tax=Paraburkholderia tuberum TaxID=157910 RepID=UPI000A020255|nr:Rha family transcriptional regulator [Paraburkholderia tuberum]